MFGNVVLNGSLNYEVCRNFSDISVVNGFKFAVVYPTPTDSPYPNQQSWWNVLEFGESTRLTQITSQAFDGYPGKNELWIRSKHDNVWSGWVKL